MNDSISMERLMRYFADTESNSLTLFADGTWAFTYGDDHGFCLTGRTGDDMESLVELLSDTDPDKYNNAEPVSD